MMPLTDVHLRRLIEGATPVNEHPVHELLLEKALEDTAQGGDDGTRRLLTRASGHRLSRGDLEVARQNAQVSGQRGEEFVSVYVSGLISSGNLVSFEWSSQENAISPFDFLIANKDGSKVLIDVKSTSGEFDRRIHISTNELQTMAADVRQYDLYRVFEIEGNGAQLRIARDLRYFGQSVLESFSAVPEGVTIDGISVIPEYFAF